MQPFELAIEVALSSAEGMSGNSLVMQIPGKTPIMNAATSEFVALANAEIVNAAWVCPQLYAAMAA
jgi:hypothetical protein